MSEYRTVNGSFRQIHSKDRKVIVVLVKDCDRM